MSTCRFFLGTWASGHVWPLRHGGHKGRPGRSHCDRASAGEGYRGRTWAGEQSTGQEAPQVGAWEPHGEWRPQGGPESLGCGEDWGLSPPGLNVRIQTYLWQRKCVDSVPSEVWEGSEEGRPRRRLLALRCQRILSSERRTREEGWVSEGSTWVIHQSMGWDFKGRGLRLWKSTAPNPLLKVLPEFWGEMS